MTVVRELLGRVDSHTHGEPLLLITFVTRNHRKGCARLQGVIESLDVVRLEAREAHRVAGGSIHELQREYSHSNQVGAVDPLERLGDDGAHSQKQGALRGPVARRTGAVLLAGHHDQRNLEPLILHCGLEDRHRLAALAHGSPATLRARRELVPQADVRERAAHHHLVVPAARAVRVEVLRLHALLDQPAARRAGCRNGARRRDVVRGDRVAQLREKTRAPDRLNAGRLERHSVKVRRVLHVGGLGAPAVRVAGGHLQRAPLLVALEDVRVLRAEHLRLHAGEDLVLHFLLRRPDVAKEHRAVVADAQRLVLQVNVHATGERVGDYKRRRRQVVEPGERIDASLEVAVAGQHARNHQLVLLDGVRDRVRQRAGVSDARGASEAHDVEAECVEIRLHAGLLQVVLHHARSRCQRRLYPRPRLQSLLASLACEKTRREHHARVGGVRAARDGCDHHRAVPELEGLAVHGHRYRLAAKVLFRFRKHHGGELGLRRHPVRSA